MDGINQQPPFARVPLPQGLSEARQGRLLFSFYHYLILRDSVRRGWWHPSQQGGSRHFL